MKKACLPGYGCVRAGEVIVFFRDLASHAAAAIDRFGSVPRDNVHVHMRHGMAGNRTRVKQTL